MIESINAIRSSGGAATVSLPSSVGTGENSVGESFKEMFLKGLNEVNTIQQEADTTLENYVTGKTHNVGEVINASQKASLAFSMLVQIRNKLQESYDELKNLRI